MDRPEKKEAGRQRYIQKRKPPSGEPREAERKINSIFYKEETETRGQSRDGLFFLREGKEREAAEAGFPNAPATMRETNEGSFTNLREGKEREAAEADFPNAPATMRETAERQVRELEEKLIRLQMVEGK